MKYTGLITIAFTFLLSTGSGFAAISTLTGNQSGGPATTELNFDYDFGGIDWSSNTLTGAVFNINSSINDTSGDDLFYFESSYLGVSTSAYPSEVAVDFDVFALIGDLSSDAILSATIITSDYDGYWNDAAYWYTELTLTYEENVVPEPSILALMGLGIFGLGLARRRRPS